MAPEVCRRHTNRIPMYPENTVIFNDIILPDIWTLCEVCLQGGVGVLAGVSYLPMLIAAVIRLTGNMHRQVKTNLDSD